VPQFAQEKVLRHSTLVGVFTNNPRAGQETPVGETNIVIKKKSSIGWANSSPIPLT
jgi:hypothetical protein